MGEKIQEFRMEFFVNGDDGGSQRNSSSMRMSADLDEIGVSEWPIFRTGGDLVWVRELGDESFDAGAIE